MREIGTARRITPIAEIRIKKSKIWQRNDLCQICHGTFIQSDIVTKM